MTTLVISQSALLDMHQHHVGQSLANGSEPMEFAAFAAHFCDFFGYACPNLEVAA